LHGFTDGPDVFELRNAGIAVRTFALSAVALSLSVPTAAVSAAGARSDRPVAAFRYRVTGSWSVR
jgi:hypothetical protein